MTKDHHAEAEYHLGIINGASPDGRSLPTGMEAITHALLALDDTLRTILCWEEPPEEVLARVKAETLEKAAQEGRVANQDHLSHTHLAAPQPATDAPEPAQTLADLTPCLGDRVRAESCGEDRGVLTYAWMRAEGAYVWLGEEKVWWAVVDRLDQWTVLEHLDPVTPEEPPVGAGMLVDQLGNLFCRRDDGRWLLRHPKDTCWQAPSWEWAELTDLSLSRFRPATPADLAEHGVDEQGEPVGKGEAFREQYPELRRWLAGDNVRGPSVVHDLNAALDFLGVAEAGDR